MHPAHTGRPIGRFIDFKFLDADIRQWPLRRLHAWHDHARPAAGARADDGRGGAQLQRYLGQRQRRYPLRYRGALARASSNRRSSRSTWRAGGSARPTPKPAVRRPIRPRACLPAGFPRFLNMVFPGEILQAEHQLNWYAEFGEATLRIYLDGRAPPARSGSRATTVSRRALGRQHACHEDERSARRHADRYDRSSAQRSTDGHDADARRLRRIFWRSP